MSSPKASPAVAPGAERRPSVDGCTCFKARRLARALVRFYDRELASSGVNIGQFSMLRTLASAPLRSGELAIALGLDRTTLTRNLRPLIESGFIVSSRGSDARTRQLAITDKGRETMRRSRTDWRRAQCRIEDALGALRTSLLHDVLDGTFEEIDTDDVDEEALAHEVGHERQVA